MWKGNGHIFGETYISYRKNNWDGRKLMTV